MFIELHVIFYYITKRLLVARCQNNSTSEEVSAILDELVLQDFPPFMASGNKKATFLQKLNKLYYLMGWNNVNPMN